MGQEQEGEQSMSKEKWERIPGFPYPTTSFTVSSLLLLEKSLPENQLDVPLARGNPLYEPPSSSSSAHRDQLVAATHSFIYLSLTYLSPDNLLS